MAEVAVSMVLEKLGDALIHKKLNILPRDQIEELFDELRRLQGFLKDADAKKEQGGEHVRCWLSDIGNLAYDAEVVIDTFLLKVYSNSSIGGIKNVIIRKTLMVKNMIHLHRVSNEILAIQARLKAIFDIIRYGIKLPDHEASSSETIQKKYPHLVDDDVIGFKEHTKTILAELMKDDERRCVVSIVGVGGLGKTTLAKEIYKHGIVRSSFDCWGWCSISQRLNLKDVLGEIMNCMSLPNNELQMNATDLTEKICNYLQDKRYFVVLDDVWNIDDWNTLSCCFPVGKKGSKVLLTTRNKAVALQADPFSLHFEPQFLSEDDSWELLAKKAFPKNMEDVNDFSVSLEKLGRDMVRKCGGLPLGICILGEILATKRSEIKGWEFVCRDVISYINGGETGGVNRILALSYNDLPSRLKPCFLYLSLFPEDYAIPTKKLIQLWIAEGFVSHTTETLVVSMEDIGQQYLSELSQRCMIQIGKEYIFEKGKIGSVCRVHNLMRELCFVKAKEVKSINNPKHLRRVFCIQGLTSKQTPAEVSSNKHLRVLELRNCTVATLPDLSKLILLRYLDLRGCSSLTELPRDIGSLENLRYLDLSCTGIKVLPESISRLQSLQELYLNNSQLRWLPTDFGDLEQLRHLDVSSTNIKTLPHSVTRLSNLRTLKLDGCRYVESLPSEFSNLTHLKCLDLSGTRIKELPESVIRRLCNLETLKLGHCKLPQEVGHLKCLKHFMFEGDKFETPGGIRQLTRPQTLQQFVVREDNESDGGGIGDLEGLNLLKGKIKICKLENVQDRKDADRANLKGKHHLRCLDLHWSWRPFNVDYSSNDGMVLDALQPNPELEILKIKNFMGSGPPQWMGGSLSSYLPKLEELVLSECSQWQQLPALGKLPNLKVLSISGMSSVKSLGSELYGGVSGTGGKSPTRPLMECSQWEQLLALEQLSYLELLSISEMSSVKCLGNELHEGEGSTSGKKLTGLPGLFPSLIELTLEDMEKLESWDVPESTLSPFPLLEKLTISFCNKLKVVRTPFPSLKELQLQSCQLLEDLPDIQCLEALQKFNVKDCKELKLSPDALKHIFSTALLDIDAPLDAF